MSKFTDIAISLDGFKLKTPEGSVTGGFYSYERTVDAHGRVIEREEGTLPPFLAPLINSAKANAMARIQGRQRRHNQLKRLIAWCRTAARASQDGTFYLSGSGVGRLLDVSQSTALSLMRALREKGVLERLERFEHRKPAKYRFTQSQQPQSPQPAKEIQTP